MMVTNNKKNNITNAKKWIEKAVKEQKAQMVVLPECFNCPYSNACFPEYAEKLPSVGDKKGVSDTSTFLSDVAKEHKVWLVGGSVPESSDGKIFNTSLVVNPDGEFIAKHRKVHLFDIDVPGGIRFMESDTLTGGSGLTVFDTPFCKVGLGICYDIRFAEYAHICQQAGAQLLLYPGAFNTTTGPMHWELLQRGRAVDTQCYVATAPPARDPDFSY
eukprot:UN32326